MNKIARLLKKKGILMGAILLMIGLTSSAISEINNYNNVYTSYLNDNNGDDEEDDNNTQSNSVTTDKPTDSFEVYPEKTSRTFIVEFEEEGQDVTITIFNEYGEVVRESDLYTKSAIREINIKHLEEGIYYIKIDSENKSGIEKITKI